MFPVAVLVVVAAVGTARGLIALRASLTVSPSLFSMCVLFFISETCTVVAAISNQHMQLSVVGIITGEGGVF